MYIFFLLQILIYKSFNKIKQFYTINSSQFLVDQKEIMNCLNNSQESEYKNHRKHQEQKRTSFPVYLANLENINILPSVSSQKNILYKHKTDFGIFNQYKLEGFIDYKTDSTLGQIINVVSVSSNALHAQNKFIDLMQRYSKFQIAFVGVYGKKGSGKSLFLDKMINLLDFQGTYFCDKKDKSIKLWTVPLTKNNTKIFFIQCSGLDGQIQQPKQDQMMIDLLLLLSSVIILVIDPHDIQGKGFSSLYKNIRRSSQRMIANGKAITFISQFWPQSGFITFRDDSIIESQRAKKVQSLFRDPNKIVIYDAGDKKYAKQFKNEDLKKISLSLYNQNKIFLNQLYLKQLTVLVKSLYKKIKSKKFGGIRSIGSNIACIFMNAVQSLNIKEQINFGSLIKKSSKQISIDGYNSTIVWYNKKLEKSLGSQEPLNINNLLQILQKTYLQTFQVFKKITDNSSEQYEKKLQNYIREKQKIVFQVNKKKSVKKLKKGLENIKIKQISMNQIIQIREVLYRTKVIQRNLDSGRLEAIKEKLMQAWNKHKSVQDKIQSQQIQKLQSTINRKKIQLQSLIQKNHDIQVRVNTQKTKLKSFQVQTSELQSKVQNLKFEVSVQKNKNKLALQNSLQRIHRFAKTQKQLVTNLKDYTERLSHQYEIKQKELKNMKEQNDEANNLIKMSVVKQEKVQNETSGINLKTHSKIADQNFIVSERLLNSRIATKDQNVKLIRSRIDLKIKSQAQLQQIISNIYINFQRPLTVYKNNIQRGTQKRSVKQNSPIKIS